MRPLPRLIAGLALLVAPGLLLAASSMSAPSPRPQSQPQSLTAQLREATVEAEAAEASAQKLEQAAGDARDEAERMRARQAAAGEAIAAAEARITAADARLRLIAARMIARRERLAEQQAPAGALLAGLALMASRPPMLTILDSGSTEEFVRVRLLLDSTLPVIRSRTAALSAELEQGMRLQRSARAARAESLRFRQDLADRRRDFAALEEQALRLARQRGGEALGAGDVALASREQAGSLERQAERSRAALSIAADLAAMPAAPARPGSAREPGPAPALIYRLPASAAVVDGFGSVSPAGIRSRGLLLATARGTSIQAPASGIVRFSGPFRTYDGIVIIDHGNGWMSLITNVSSKIEPGTGVTPGQPLGRALGPIGVELSRNGQHVSPALIAGSSQKLSKRAEQG